MVCFSIEVLFYHTVATELDLVRISGSGIMCFWQRSSSLVTLDILPASILSILVGPGFEGTVRPGPSSSPTSLPLPLKFLPLALLITLSWVIP